MSVCLPFAVGKPILRRLSNVEKSVQREMNMRQEPKQLMTLVSVPMRNRVQLWAAILFIAAGCVAGVSGQIPLPGSDKSLVPREVVLVKSESIPVRLDGQTVGKAGCPAGTVLKVESVAGDMLTIAAGTERYLIPVASTDYLNRVAVLREKQRLVEQGTAIQQDDKAAQEEEKLKAFLKKNMTALFVGSVERITKKGFFVNIDWIGTPGSDYKRSLGCLDDFSYPKGRVFISDADTSELSSGDIWKSGSEVGGKAVYGIGVTTNAMGGRCLLYTTDFEKYYDAMKDVSAKKVK